MVGIEIGRGRRSERVMVVLIFAVTVSGERCFWGEIDIAGFVVDRRIQCGRARGEGYGASRQAAGC